MPAQSQAQRGLIFGKRNQYKTKAKTPDKWKWIWDEDWENKGKLPKKVTEGIGFEETQGGDQYIDDVIDMLQDLTKMSFNEAERYFEKYYDFVADCYSDEMSSSDCAEALLTKAEKELEETVQNVVMKENQNVIMKENFRARTVNEDVYGDPYVSDDTRPKQKEEDEGWTLKAGDEVIFNLRGMGPEFEDADEGDIVKYDGKMAIIDSPETASEVGDRDYEYYNIWFPGKGPGEGEMFYGVSGYHLDDV